MRIKTNNLYYSVIKFIQRKGKSSYVRTAFDFTAFALTYFNKKALYHILTTTLKKMPFFIEVRPVTFRQRIVDVPFPISTTRSNFLQKQLFVQFLKTQNKRTKLGFSLANSLMLESFGSAECILINSYNQKLEKIKTVKGNSHYRWG